MQLINNRFRVLREIDSVTFAVRDTEDNARKIIRIPDCDVIDDNLRDFFADEYEIYKNIAAPEIVKSLDFGRIRHVDGSKNPAVQYFMLSEYTKNEPFATKIKPVGNTAALKMFADACRAAYYLHLKNIIHGDICPETLHIEENGSFSGLRFRNPATVELWRRGKNANVFFKAPEAAYDGKVTRAADIYSLGVLLFKLICECEEETDFALAYGAVKKQTPDKFARRLFPIIDRMTDKDEGERFPSVKAALEALNAEFKTDFKAFDKNALGRLNPSIGLVGNGAEEVLITEELDKTVPNAGHAESRCICVHGGYGVGLTALLADLVKKWSLQGRAVYYALGTPGESLGFMLKQLLADYNPKVADKGVIRQVNAIINGAGTENFTQNLLLKFIYDCVKDSPAVLVIDSAHLAGAATFDLLAKLMEVSRKTTVLLAYRTDYESRVFDAFLNSLPEGRLEVLLRPLNEDETVTFLRRKLSLPSAPVLFAKEVYAATRGNPMFISEILKSLTLNGTLYINDEGFWHIDFDKEFGYSRLPLHSTVKQISSEQAARLSADQRILLETLAVFTTPVSVKEIAECSGFVPARVLSAAKECEAQGFVKRSQYRGTGFYTFDFKILRDFLYEGIAPDERTRLHKAAAGVLKNRKDAAFLADVVYHMEKAGIRDASLASNLTEIGRRLMSVGVLKKAAETFEEALAIPGCDRIEILLNLGRVLYDSGSTDKGIECLKEAANLARDEKDLKYRVRSLYCAAGAIVEKSVGNWVLPELLRIFAEHPALKDELTEEYFGTLDVQARVEPDMAKRIRMFKTAYMQCPEEFYNIRAGILLGWGHAEYVNGDASEAARVWEAARPFTAMLTNMRYLTSLLNNLSGVAQAEDDFDASRQIITEGIDLCKQHGLLRNEEYLLISLLDCHFKCAEFEKTIPLVREISELEKIQGRESLWLMFRACLYMDRYTEAYSCVLQMEEAGTKIGHYEKEEEFDPVAYAEYLSGRARFALYMGDDDAARDFLDMEEAECEGGVVNDYTAGKYRPFLDALPAVEAGDGEGVLHSYNAFLMATGTFWHRQETLFHLAEFMIFLHDCGGLPLLGSKAGEVMDRLGRYATAPVVKARYFYLRSILTEGPARFEDLREARKYASACEQNLPAAKCSILLGEYYKSRSRYYSYYHFAEANAMVRRLLENVPPKFHKGFVARHRLDIPADVLSVDASVWDSAREAHFARLPEGIRTPEDVLSAVGGDAQKNLSLAAKFLAAVSHAERAEIITDDEEAEFILIASDDGEPEFNYDRQMLRRVRKLEEPVLSVGRDGEKSVICVPAVLDDTVLGYIYLYAGYSIHKFNKESLEICRRLAPLAAFNINQKKAKDGALTDRLTGALNGKAFDADFDRVLAGAREYGRVFSVILCDLDKFKSVNDTFGHQTGDELLRAVGKIFRENVPPGAVFGRIGGDEFAVILDGLDSNEALDAANRLRRAVAGAKLLGSKRPVTVSMGISTYGRDDNSKTGLMEKADRALYVCKERGRNNCVPYSFDFGAKTHYVNSMDGIVTTDALRDSERMRFILSLLEMLRGKMPADEKRKQMLNAVTEIMHAETGAWLDSDFNVLFGDVSDKSSARLAAEYRVAVADTGKERPSLFSPVLRGGNVIGVICVAGKPGNKDYGPDDTVYLQYLCGFAAMI